MTLIEIIQIVLFFGLGIALTPPLGKFMWRVYKGERTLLHPVFHPIEKSIYRVCGVDPDEEMSWKKYLWAVILFSTLGAVVLFAMFFTQYWLPLNPQKLANCSWHLAFMQAWSFACNADWQSYMGESTMSYLSQVLGIMVHQFLSGAVGLAVLVAVGRALYRHSAKTIGNFWTDLTRGVLYIQLPLCLLMAIPLAWQGCPQTLKPYVDARLVEPYTIQVPKTDDQGQPVKDDKGAPVMVDQKVETQSVPLGWLASFMPIKQLFTNGGGWFGVNSAHPYENPTPLTNFLELLAIIIVPMAQVYMFGLLVGNLKHAWCLFAVMLGLFVASFAIAWWAEAQPNPVVHSIVPNMEGKEQRIGVMNSVLWGVSCTAIDNGSVNSMHDSWMPLAGLMPMWNILIGEIIFGGIGCGMYSMLFHVLITVFIAGLMIGRTPEYLGKKLDATVATWAVIGVLIPNAAALIPTAIACVIPQGLSSLNNGGPHGLSEILYCFGEAANNNGSAFAGLNANTIFYNVSVGIVIWIGRFIPIIAALAIVGHLASQKTVESSAGTLPTHGWTFGLTLTGVIVIVAALTFFPVLCLSPIVEHGLMVAGRASKETTMSTKIEIKYSELVKQAVIDAFKKLHPRDEIKNLVMFVVWVGSIWTTIILFTPGGCNLFNVQICLWLWFTCLFANFAEAMAEGRGKAHADALRRMRTKTMANVIVNGKKVAVASSELKIGDLFVCEAGDMIPADGEIEDGIATVDESAITGESAPVIREAGGDRSAVTGGTKVISDRIIVRVTAEEGHSFLDRMIAMIEGARRQKTPNEIALNIVLVSLTALFIVVVFTLPPYARYNENAAGQSGVVLTSIPVLLSLIVCLIPTTIGGLLSAIGIAGIDRLMRRNVLATSGRAVEAAGDVDVLLLDKTGTITLGNRMATEFIPSPGVTVEDLADVAELASLADETPEGRSIVTLAKDKYNRRAPIAVAKPHAVPVPFTAQTRMSGLDLASPDGKGVRVIRKGAAEAMRQYVEAKGGLYPKPVQQAVLDISTQGGTPLVVADGSRVMGVIRLKDVVKGGIKERFEQLRRMGVRTVMITGDNPQTAAAIAAEAGVDDFIAQARPEDKLARIRREQEGGKLIAMIGDGTNDAPALAQADVGVAMNTGTQAAREAGNMVDLDSNPTKLIEVVEIGKQLLMTRGALTTFSIANDVSKYFAILPAMFGLLYALNAGGRGPLDKLNIMFLHSPQSAILSAVIFNALIIVALIPLALKGVKYRPLGAAIILRNNMLIYGIGGIIMPFIFIKLIDIALVALHLAQ